jgi:predicted transcriptional regulator
MTLQNKSWLKNEISRLYLSGHSQQTIANELNISIGTVNNLVSEIINSDDTTELQRQIAIVAKKKKVDIIQIAANLRFKNMIKISVLDDRSAEKLLDGLEILFNKYSISPSNAKKLLFSIIEMILRDNIEPNRLEEQIKSKNAELERINSEIETRDKVLEEIKAKALKEQLREKVNELVLKEFREVSLMLGFYGHPEIPTEYGDVARAFIQFKKLGYDPKVIVAEYGKSISLTEKIKKLEAQLQNLEKILES